MTLRRALLIVVLLSPLRASATECVTVSWTARDFLAATTTAARAVAIGPDTLRVTSTLFGKEVHEGDIIRVVPGICRPIDVGVGYFVAMRCSSESECQWSWTEAERSEGYEQYARQRHLVTRSEVMKKLEAWGKRKLSTEELQRWLSTADARDGDGTLSESLALAVVEQIEDLLEFAGEAQACDPSDAAWLREHGSRIFLERFARLPKQETRIAYDAWLDAQEDAEDEWDPETLQSDLELALEGARPWDHAIDCFLKSHPEAPR
jgi:hypothetical protein